jgi:hypothetical protein
MDGQHIPPGVVELGQHEGVGPHLEVPKPGLHGRLEHQPAVRRSFVALLGALRSVSGIRRGRSAAP